MKRYFQILWILLFFTLWMGNFISAMTAEECDAWLPAICSLISAFMFVQAIKDYRRWYRR